MFFGNRFGFSKRNIPSGDVGTDQTLDAMISMTRTAISDPLVIEFSRRISSQFSRKSNLDLLYGIVQYVRSVWTFRRDPIGMELLVTPQRIINDIQSFGTHAGDCDEASVLIASMLMCLGIPARFVVVQRKPSSPMYDHVFVEALHENDWISMDGIAFGRDIFFRADGLRRKEYMI